MTQGIILGLALSIIAWLFLLRVLTWLSDRRPLLVRIAYALWRWANYWRAVALAFDRGATEYYAARHDIALQVVSELEARR